MPAQYWAQYYKQFLQEMATFLRTKKHKNKIGHVKIVKFFRHIFYSENISKFTA
jgi:hypothetical protein